MPANLERVGSAQDLTVLRRAEAGEIAVNEWGISYYWCSPDGTAARRMRYREQDHVAILQGARLLADGDRRVLVDASGERFVGITLALTDKAVDLLHRNNSENSSTREG